MHMKLLMKEDENMEDIFAAIILRLINKMECQCFF